MSNGDPTPDYFYPLQDKQSADWASAFQALDNDALEYWRSTAHAEVRARKKLEEELVFVQQLLKELLDRTDPKLSPDEVQARVDAVLADMAKDRLSDRQTEAVQRGLVNASVRRSIQRRPPWQR